MDKQTLNDRYILDRKIGDGGMARVYLARDVRLDRPVAVKVLHSRYASDPTFLRRFLLEAQAAARLQHPGIVEVYDVGHDGDTQYIVMEYVEGSDLKSLLLRRGALPLDQALAVAETVAEALDVAHRAGLIHRDIKPQNIMVDADGRAKITDFGIVKSSVASNLTETGVVFGTADYIAPEQAGGKQATPQSDLYALGVTLYEMLTGRLPFTGDGAIAVAMQHLSAPPPAPRLFNPRIPGQVEALILQLLSKDPADRPASARELARTLRALRSAGDQATVVAPAVAQRNVPRPQTRPANPVPQPTPQRLPPRRPNDPPPQPARSWGLGSFVVGLVVLAGVLGVVYLAATGAFSGLFSFNGVAARPTPITGFPAQDPNGLLPTETPTPEPTSAVKSEVPDLVGLDKLRADELLRNAKLRLVEGPAKPSDTVEAGRILEQVPAARTSIGQGSPVTVTLSLGSDAPLLPEVANRRADDAERVLQAAGFVVQRVDEPSRTLDAGFVIRSEPRSPARPPRGSTVTIFVSIGNKVRMPVVAGRNLDEARRLIAEAGLFVSFEDMQGPEKIPNFDSIPANTVVSSEPRGGTLVNAGSGVTLGVRRP